MKPETLPKDDKGQAAHREALAALRLDVQVKTLPADTVTPVSLYLKLRDRYPGTLLLECTDYHSRENSYSLIALEPLASFVVEDGLLQVSQAQRLIIL